MLKPHTLMEDEDNTLLDPNKLSLISKYWKDSVSVGKTLNYNDRQGIEIEGKIIGFDSQETRTLYIQINEEYFTIDVYMHSQNIISIK